MVRVIVVSSGKGGVGKTTAVSNLAAALAGFGKKVVVIDANLTTSNLGLHFGVPLNRPTLQDVLKRKARLEQAIWTHPAGFKVIPADISVSKVMSAKPNQLLSVLNRILSDADFVLIDSAAGLCQEALAALKAADEVLVVTNPELPALTDALKLIKFAEEYGTKNIGVVLNRVNGKSHEWSDEEVEKFLGAPVIARVSEDVAVQRAIAEKMPVVLHNPGSRAAREFKELAARLAGIKFSSGPSWLYRLWGWLVR